MSSNAGPNPAVPEVTPVPVAPASDDSGDADTTSTIDAQEEDITIELPGKTNTLGAPYYAPIELQDGSQHLSVGPSMEASNHPSLHKSVSSQQLAKMKERLTFSAFSFQDMDTKVKDEIFSHVGEFFLVALAYGGLAFLVGETMLPGGAAWCVFILWFASTITGSICKSYKVPALLGNLIIGIILKNLPGTWLCISLYVCISLSVSLSLSLSLPFVYIYTTFSHLTHHRTTYA